MNNMYHMLGRPSAFVLLNPCLHCSWSFLATPVYPSVSIMSFWTWMQVSIGCGHNCQSWGSQSTSQQTNQKLNSSKPQALSVSLWWLSVFVFFLVLRFPENVSLCCIEKHMEAALVLKWFVFFTTTPPVPQPKSRTCVVQKYCLERPLEPLANMSTVSLQIQKITHWKNNPLKEPKGLTLHAFKRNQSQFLYANAKNTFYSCQIPKPMGSTAFNTSQNFGIRWSRLNRTFSIFLICQGAVHCHLMASHGIPFKLSMPPSLGKTEALLPIHTSPGVTDIHGISRNISTDQSIMRPMRDLQHLVKDRLQIAPRASEKMQFPKQGNGQSKCSMQAATFFPCLSVSTYDSIPWESCHMTSNVNQAFKRRLKLIEGA